MRVRVLAQVPRFYQAYQQRRYTFLSDPLPSEEGRACDTLDGALDGEVSRDGGARQGRGGPSPQCLLLYVYTYISSKCASKVRYNCSLGPLPSEGRACDTLTELWTERSGAGGGSSLGQV